MTMSHLRPSSVPGQVDLVSNTKNVHDALAEVVGDIKRMGPSAFRAELDRRPAGELAQDFAAIDVVLPRQDEDSVATSRPKSS